MKVPEINSEQEYFDLNKEDWNLSDPNQEPKDGDQIIIETMAIPMGGIIDPNDEHLGFKALYYRGTFVEKHEDNYCDWNTLAGEPTSPVKIDMIRVVPNEKVWEVEL